MRVLIVYSSVQSGIAPFIKEQIESVKKLDVQISCFAITKPGIFGYLLALKPLKRKIKDFNPDVVHAHYGLSGLLASMQRKVKVIITFHGSDINFKSSRKYSKIASFLSRANIFVSPEIMKLMPEKIQHNSYLIPCGVDTSIFLPKDKIEIRKKFGFDLGKKYILFSSAFDNQVKNYLLARQAVNLCKEDIILLELKGYSRNEVAEIMNAVDLCLLTSFSEGSPQFIKEAMACNKPIVATDVGDIKWLFGNAKGLFITSFAIEEVAINITSALKCSTSEGRNRIEELDLDLGRIAEKIFKVYKTIIA